MKWKNRKIELMKESTRKLTVNIFNDFSVFLSIFYIFVVWRAEETCYNTFCCNNQALHVTTSY